MNKFKQLRFREECEVETQTDLANSIGITQQNLSKIERDIHDPNFKTLKKIYKRFGIEVIEELLND